jgi:hypothetical protein
MSSVSHSRQVEVVRQFYAPVVHPRPKQQIYPVYAFGSESLWNAGSMVADSPYGRGQYFKYAVFQDPNWVPPRFKAASIPWLERPADSTSDEHPMLRKRKGVCGRCEQG